MHRREYRLVLDRRADYGSATALAQGAPRSEDGEVVPFGSARGEADLVGVRAQTSGHALARLVQRGARLAPPSMGARRVAEARSEERLHRLEHLRTNRRGRGVI